jgi:hypothetical protein
LAFLTHFSSDGRIGGQSGRGFAWYIACSRGEAAGKWEVVNLILPALIQSSRCRAGLLQCPLRDIDETKYLKWTRYVKYEILKISSKIPDLWNASMHQNFRKSISTDFCYKKCQNNSYNNNTIFSIVQSTVSDLLKDSNLLGLEWKSPGPSSSYFFCQRETQFVNILK